MAEETVATNNNTSKAQLEKAKIAGDNDYTGLDFFNVKLACIDESVKDKAKFNSEQQMKVVCFFIPKHNKGKEFYNPENAIYVPYSTVVKGISLTDSLDCIGMKGTIDLSDMGGSLNGVFERHNNYYFVINFTEIVKTDGTSIKYEPYIFDIVSVDTITKNYKKEKIVRMNVIDIITSILQSHSVASLIHFEKNITKEKNYKKVFERIVNYVKRFLKINMDNTLEFKKDVLFDEYTTYKGESKINGYDADVALEKLVIASFNKIDRNASIWEAMDVLLKDCVTSLKLSDDVKAQFETIGDVLIPFFFKEEYADSQGIYSTWWREVQGGDQTQPTSNGGSQQTPVQTTTQPTETTPQPTTADTPVTTDESSATSNSETDTTLETPVQQTTQDQVQSAVTNAAKRNNEESLGKMTAKEITISNYGGESVLLALRNITMRDFFMPFYLCFHKNNKIIFEDINKNPNVAMTTMNGVIVDNLQSLQFKAIPKGVINKRWKNAIFLDAAGSGSNCTIIFFDWFYRFFLKVFLDSSTVGGSSRYISNVIPDFYLFSLKHNVGYANDANETSFDNMFDEYNSYTYVIESKDTVNDALREMGKSLTSLILDNDSYKFVLKGNLLRRPNEIIRLNVHDLTNGGDLQLPLFTTLKGDSSIFVYIKEVTHEFRGDAYVNHITATKICESI